LYYAAAATVAMVLVIGTLVVWYPLHRSDMAVNKSPEKGSAPEMGIPVQQKDKSEESVLTRNRNNATTASEETAVNNSQNNNPANTTSEQIIVTTSPAGPGSVTSDVTINREGELSRSSQDLDEARSESVSGGGISSGLTMNSSKAYGGATRSRRMQSAEAPAYSTRSNRSYAYKVKGKYDYLYDQSYSVVEESPKFDGGENGLYKYIKRHLVYPNKAIDEQIEGVVLVKFMVDENGNVADTKVVQGVDKLLDDEAIRVINKLPKWDPGKMGGIPVRVYYIIPVEFKISR